MSIPEELPIEIVTEEENSIIKVMGVGGGGCNAVNYMYATGIHGVSFLVCNTDKQSLGSSLIPHKLQLGPGLGAGGRPEVSQKYAEESAEKIKEALNDGTKMVFITAGMGGGTGTGAAPVVARIAREMDILTIGIVTIPFQFEGPNKIRTAMAGVKGMADNVDALLVINNERLTEMYGDLDLQEGFRKADDVLAKAAKSIAEIITVPGYINIDFADVYNTLKDGRVAIMNVGEAEGEQRIAKALENALESPLANNADVRGASRILMQLNCKSMKGSELQQVTEFTQRIGRSVDVSWGVTFDDTLGDKVKVILVATGYDLDQLPGVIPTNENDYEGAAQHAYSKDIKQKEKFRPTQTEGQRAAIIDIDDDPVDDPEDVPTWLRKKNK